MQIFDRPRRILVPRILFYAAYQRKRKTDGFQDFFWGRSIPTLAGCVNRESARIAKKFFG